VDVVEIDPAGGIRLQCRDRDISQPHRLLNEIAAAIVFAQAATVLLDPLAVTVFDAAHSQNEERWFTLGTSSEGKLLAVSHSTTSPRAPRRPTCGSSPRERPHVANVTSSRTNPDRHTS
jgi:hypothetical protein